MIQHLLRRVCISVLCLIAILIVAPSASAATGDTEGASQALIEACKNMDATVDLTDYKITPDQLDDIFSDNLHNGAYPWYVYWYASTYYPDSGYIANVTLEYLDPEVYDYSLYEQKVAEILAETVHEGMNDWQIALAIHDYLVAYITYDETLTYYEGYDAIVNGYAVCNGYAEAYMDLLNRVGIPCHEVISDSMGHGWNLVYVSGNWLHVDATWDDPITDQEGRVLHDYFLISDQMISDSNHNHYGWDTDITCSFTDWDSNLFWHGIESQICYKDAETCYLRYKTGDTSYTIYQVTDYGGTWDVVTSYDCGYIDIGGSKDYSYFYGHNGLSLWNGRLYYSDMTKVYSIKPDGTGKKTVYTHDYSSKKSYIAGCHVQDGILYLTFSKHDGKLSTKTVDLGISHHSHSYKCTTVSATCVSQGYSTYTCSCGISYTADRTPVSDTHRYSTTTVAPTCDSEGYDRHVCSDCGDSYDDNYVDKMTHLYTAQTVEPTCTEQGYDHNTCKLCGYTYDNNYTDPLPHNYKTETVPATCTEQGYDHHVCSDCGHTMDDNQTPLLDHTYDDGTVTREPSPDTQGITEYHCIHCDRTVTEYVPYEDPFQDTDDDGSGDHASAGFDPVPLIRPAIVIVVITVIFLLTKKKKKVVTAAPEPATVAAKATATHTVPPEPAPAPAKFCPKCGQKLEAGHRFCPQCGNKRPE